jgi:hypothetical protein
VTSWYDSRVRLESILAAVPLARLSGRARAFVPVTATTKKTIKTT